MEESTALKEKELNTLIQSGTDNKPLLELSPIRNPSDQIVGRKTKDGENANKPAIFRYADQSVYDFHPDL
jgi:hypothetical protein